MFLYIYILFTLCRICASSIFIYSHVVYHNISILFIFSLSIKLVSSKDESYPAPVPNCAKKIFSVVNLCWSMKWTPNFDHRSNAKRKRKSYTFYYATELWQRKFATIANFPLFPEQRFFGLTCNFFNYKFSFISNDCNSSFSSKIAESTRNVNSIVTMFQKKTKIKIWQRDRRALFLSKGCSHT